MSEPKLTTKDWAYFAGLFDGEGHVLISMPSEARSQGRGYVSMSGTQWLSITNKNPKPLMELEERFGGRVRVKDSGRNVRSSRNQDNWGECYVWFCQGDKSVEFAKKILPHARIKAGQLEVFLAYMALRRRRRTGLAKGGKLSVDELTQRRALVAQLKLVRVEEGGRNS